MANTKQDFNNTPAGIAIVSALSALLSYRAIRKDPQKVLRIRKKSPLIAAGVLAALAAGRHAVLNSDNPQVRAAAQKNPVDLKKVAVGGAALSAAGLLTAKVVIGERTSVSVRRALVWVALTTAYGAANRVYNRSALPTAEAVEDLTEDEQFEREVEEMLAELRQRRQWPNA